MHIYSINTSTNYIKITSMWRRELLNSAVRILYNVCYSDAKVHGYVTTEPIGREVLCATSGVHTQEILL